jgi:hypothetical protein
MKSDLRRDSASRLIALTLGALIAVIVASGTPAGIQGSGFRSLAAIGTLDTSSGFVVNGIPYDVSRAKVTVDGAASNPSALRQGQVITVQGTVSADGSTATANEISVVNNVRGAVTAVDTAAATVTVLGQTVRFSDRATLASLSPGTEVVASGYTSAEGELIASRLDAEPSGSVSQVRGLVTDFDPTADSFQINGLAVDYSNARISGPLAADTWVTVQGTAVGDGFALLATRVDVAASPGAPGEDGDVAGLITRFASASDFDVNGLHVLGDEGTKYPPQHALGLDAAVRIKGRFDASGALVADQIHVDPSAAKPARKAEKANKEK